MKVILVDDEIFVVNAIKRRVSWDKYGVDEVFTANSMRQAQEIFEREQIDFMLCDIEMPQGNGLELYEWVKENRSEVPCVFVTCHPDFEYIRQALRLGSEDYILKPINYVELDEILVKLTERLRKEKEAKAIPESIILSIAKEESEKGTDKTVHAVKKYVLEHIQENIRVEDIAKEVYLNEKYLMRLFKKETGSSILEFIAEQRINLAKELLEKTDYPITTVASSVGYHNYSYFAKVFKRSTGYTPIAFRQQERNEEM